jgi:hypothetical protein
VSQKDKAIDSLAALLISLVSLPIALAARAWALSSLWAWFVMPLGAPAIGWAHSLGLALLPALAVGDPWAARREPTSESDWGKAIERGLTSTGGPLLVMALGWAFARFM